MTAQFNSNKGISQVQRPTATNSHRRYRATCLMRVHISVTFTLKAQRAVKQIATATAEQKQQPTRRIALPNRLPRPSQTEVSAATLASLDRGFEGAQPRFVRETLRAMSTEFIAGLHSAKLSPASNVLPERIQVPVSQNLSSSAICPTHIIAVPSPSTSQSPAPTTRKRLTVYPVHSLVLAANCTSLPTFPRTAATTRAGTSMPNVTMPIVPLRLPCPEAFPLVLSYLYTKNTGALQRALIPEGLSAAGVAGTLKQTVVIRGVWANLCALGVVDETGDEGVSVFDVIDRAWSTVLDVLKAQTTPVQQS